MKAPACAARSRAGTGTVPAPRPCGRPGSRCRPRPRILQDDWWLDAVNRPLGAYYRIGPKQITDIHAALNEVGIVYASTDTHAGWDKGNDLNRKRPKSFADKIFTIPAQKGGDGGHAIALVGYNDQGFLLQNSWDTGWGTGGYAILTYEDWTDNAMDCWVAQLGVVTQEHKAIAASNTLRTDSRGRVSLGASTVLRNREISPFVVDMGNNGQLSNSGLFRTCEDDVRAIVDVHLAEARARWGLGNKPIDVCIYAHGGLVGEKDAAANAAEWIPLLYDNQIFPIYLMWETDFMSTVHNRLNDAIRDVHRPAGGGEGFWLRAERWWNERLERLLAEARHANLGRDETECHGHQQQQEIRRRAACTTPSPTPPPPNNPVRFHLVGHSAGSIVHAHIIDALARQA